MKVNAYRAVALVLLATLLTLSAPAFGAERHDPRSFQSQVSEREVRVTSEWNPQDPSRQVGFFLEWLVGWAEQQGRNVGTFVDLWL